MSSKEPITIPAKDCLYFDDQSFGNELQHFIKEAADFELFHFGEKVDDIPSIIEFDAVCGEWKAGRLVGEARFEYEGKDFLLSINPRFGQQHLFRMLEEVFNVRITESSHAYDTKASKQQLIRKLISFLWLQLLAKGNRHGLPRVSHSRRHYGSKIRGRINVRDSLIPVKTEQKVVSTYRQKAFDDRVLLLLKGAYEILLSEYYLGDLKQPYNAKHAIDELNRSSIPRGKLSKDQYQRIKVKRIYQSYKPVLDLSWNIIRNNRDASREKGTKKSFSYFIDMAEIWEMYLRSLLQKRLSQLGWKLWEDDIQTYSGKYFGRSIIPDIVFQRDHKLLVFDAKYKMMKFRSKDVDRLDFFQIHTYIQYFQQKYDVVAGGLLYPFSDTFDEGKQRESLSPRLFGEGQGNTKFLIDGIDLKDCPSDDFDFKHEEQKFLNRMVSNIE